MCTSKEYLCNFCQFKVSTAGALLEHSLTHLFSCNHCSFRSTSRLESLIHKRDSHPSTADEMAGFEDLDHPTLVLKTTRVPRLLGAAFLPSSSTSTRLSASSLLANPARTVGMSVLSTVNSTTRPVPSSVCTPSSSLSSSSVVRTISGKSGDSYFTYRIAHDADGRVQAYECDICGFRSVLINDMFSHASTHSLADLAKSGAAAVNNVVWECFYCAFLAPLQATVVSHVIACHPNQPIQLKRLPTMPATVTSETLAEPPAALSTAISSPLELSPLSAKQPLADKTGLPPATTAAGGSAVAKRVDVKVEKKKKSDVSDEGCIWGCYYCTMQSASRNDIISHLKKQHSSEKLVVTRRRITHVVTSSSSSSAGSKLSPAAPTAVVSSDENKPVSHTTENTPMSRPEVGIGESSSMGTDNSDEVGTLGKSRKRHFSASVSSDHLQPGASSADNSESNDGNQTPGGAASAKSRRKQMAPRRVADELAAAAADEPSTNDNTSLTAGDAVMDGAANSDVLPMVTSAAAAANSARSLLTTSSGTRRHGRSTSKYDNLIKKLKMAESEETGMEIAGLLDKPHAQDPPKTSTRSSQGKALSLLTGQLVSGYVQPPNGIPTLLSPSHDHPPPILNCKSIPAKSSLSRRQSTGLKVDVVQYVEKKAKDRSRCYVYDSERMTARCGVCGTTTHGSDVVQQIHEHVAAHFNECHWACAYCTFQCNRRVAIVGHVTQCHHGQPLRIIRRRPHCSNRNKTANDSTLKQQLPDMLTVDVRARKKLRGPRFHRDQFHILTTSVMWQCAFCSRRSLFRGLIIIHMKLAHFDHSNDLHAVPQHWIRPPVCKDATSQNTDMKTGEVRLVRIEDVNRYPALSDVILSNGTDLIRELDADGENDVVAEPESTSDGNSDTAEFRCIHCHFRGVTPAVVKCHILQVHPLEDVTVLDLRSSRRLNHEHLLMCRSVECQFVSSIEKDFKGHVGAHPSHFSSSVATLSHSESKSVDCPQQTPIQSKNVKSLTSDTSPVSSARTVVAGSARSRRGTDGPIEYNDDGTMKGLELGSRAGSMKMECTHCCTVMCCDVSEMRSHLSSAHPRLVPLAIDVECADHSLPTSLFLCLVTDCDFVTSYYNVYKHHMDEEHPDSESGSRSRYQRPSHAAKRHSAPTGKQDRSFTANVRRLKKPTSVLNSSVDNGHCSPSLPSDDLPVLTPAADDTDNTLMSKKLSSHNMQYSSQDFDFSRRYKCILCSHTAATLADMKSHLTSRHDSTTVHQCIDRRARQLRKRQGIYFCPDPKCAFCCKFDDELALHMDQEHPSLVSTAASPPTKSSQSEDSGCAGDRVYQCAHCTYITTDLRNVRVHVIAEHATTEGGFAEIKTAVSSDGSLIMNVNDAVATKSSTVGDCKSVLENGDNLAKNTGSSVKVDDEGKVFAVL